MKGVYHFIYSLLYNWLLIKVELRLHFSEGPESKCDICEELNIITLITIL